MNIEPGQLYFVKDSFFKKIQDPYLKVNYISTKRPHYYALKDKKTSLLWLIPCSSKIDKFERILEKRAKYNRPTATIMIVNIQRTKTVLLLQDMFPISEKYLDSQYMKGGAPVTVSNPKKVAEIEKNAHRVIGLIRRGIKFTPTQPDALRIEKILLEEK